MRGRTEKRKQRDQGPQPTQQQDRKPAADRLLASIAAAAAAALATVPAGGRDGDRKQS